MKKLPPASVMSSSRRVNRMFAACSPLMISSAILTSFWRSIWMIRNRPERSGSASMNELPIGLIPMRVTLA